MPAQDLLAAAAAAAASNSRGYCWMETEFCKRTRT